MRSANEMHAKWGKKTSTWLNFDWKRGGRIRQTPAKERNVQPQIQRHFKFNNLQNKLGVDVRHHVDCKHLLKFKVRVLDASRQARLLLSGQRRWEQGQNRCEKKERSWHCQCLTWIIDNPYSSRNIRGSCRPCMPVYGKPSATTAGNFRNWAKFYL